ncbi:permease-like cell division protein FtsX [Plesiomonas shigelloides]|uniref:permease-like cell division protein FtsX n=1 Tax=Plesiomonas shigelloides TaxID=703 RepID=UPI001E3718D4|nr:permease-like cell division protein FtsX [Plesiomonas shigelloides]
MAKAALKKSSDPRPTRSRGSLREQWRHAWHNCLQDLLLQPVATFLTVLVIAIALTLPGVCYLGWKNASLAADQWYPEPEITVYLQKTLTDPQAQAVADQLRQLPGASKLTYLSRADSLNEFRQWSGFSDALDMLNDNPLPAVAIIRPQGEFASELGLSTLRDKLAAQQGVSEAKLDNTWLDRLTALTELVAQAALWMATLMLCAVFLIIGNSVRLNIFNRRDSIEVMKLIGATDGFILRPFLYGGALLGLAGGLLAWLLDSIIIWRLQLQVDKVMQVFGTSFTLRGPGLEEVLLLLIVSGMIGWCAAWLATVRHLREFAPK